MQRFQRVKQGHSSKCRRLVLFNSCGCVWELACEMGRWGNTFFLCLSLHSRLFFSELFVKPEIFLLRNCILQYGVCCELSSAMKVREWLELGRRKRWIPEKEAQRKKRKLWGREKLLSYDSGLSENCATFDLARFHRSAHHFQAYEYDI